MERQDPLMGEPQRLLQDGGGVPPSLFKPIRWDPQRIGSHAVEAFAQRQQRRVPFLAHLGQDRRHPLLFTPQGVSGGAAGDGLQPGGDLGAAIAAGIQLAKTQRGCRGRRGGSGAAQGGLMGLD
jgi:hypothetical protein